MADLSISTSDAAALSEAVGVPVEQRQVSDAIVLAEGVTISIPFATRGNVAYGVAGAQNKFTSAFNPFAKIASGMKYPALAGKFNVSLTGSFVGTVTLQRSFDRGTSWVDTAETWTAIAEKVITSCEEGVLYRLGIKTGGYTSGTAFCRLSN